MCFQKSKRLTSDMSLKEMIKALKGVTSRRAFLSGWQTLLSNIKTGYDLADVVEAFGDDKVGSQNKDDIVFALIISSQSMGKTEINNMLPVLMEVQQQYCRRKFL